MAVQRPGRIVRIAPEHLVAEVAKKFLDAVEGFLLRPPDPAHHGRGQLGAQRNSQPARLACRRFDEPPAGSLTGVGHVQEQCGIGHCTSQGAVDTQAAPGVVVRRDRHPVALRLEAEQAAPTGRDANRPRPVGTQRDRRQTGSHRRAAAATAAAGRVGKIPRIVCGTVGHRFGERPQHHLRHRGLAQDDRTGFSQPPHHLGVGGGGQVVGAAAVGGELPGDVDVILDRDRNSEHRQSLAGIELLLGRCRLATGAVGHHHPIGPHLPVQPGDAIEVQLKQCGGGDGSIREHAGLFGGAGEGDFGDVH